MTPDQIFLDAALGGGRVKRKANTTRHLRLKAARLVHGSTEVLVKVVKTYAGGPRQVARQIAYIARDGEVELENDRGEQIKGTQNLRDIVKDWGESLGDTKRFKRQRDTLHVILSMPEKTPEISVLGAARAFSRRTFGDNHEYLFALHSPTNDPDPSSPNPHVHLLVKMRGFDGRRLDPRKDDLQQWRETFAEAMRDEGEDAEATPRAARGVLRKAEPSTLLHLRRRLEPVQQAPRRDVEAVRTAVDAIVGLDHPRVASRRAEAELEAAARDAGVASARAHLENRRLALAAAADRLEPPGLPHLEISHVRPAYGSVDRKRALAVRRAAALYQSHLGADGRTSSALAITSMRDMPGLGVVQDQGPAQVFLQSNAPDRLGRRGAAHLEMRRTRTRADRPAGEPSRLIEAERLATDPALLAATIRGHLSQQPRIDELLTRHEALKLTLQQRLAGHAPDLADPAPGPATAPRFADRAPDEATPVRRADRDLDR